MLCPRAQIDRDTSFSKKLRAFRNERSTKNKAFEKLYIAGKIIHLVDTTGDQTKYVPYWASRYEFNQVVLSTTMLSDHSIPPLVTILKNLNLDETHEVIAYQNVIEDDEEEEDTEVRVFICFSHPHGKVSVFVFVFAFAAWVCNIWSTQGCKFVSRMVMTSYANGTVVPGYGFSAGIWSYTLKECENPNDCDYGDKDDLQDSIYCQPYPLNLVDVEGTWAFSRAAATLASLCGFIGVGIVLFSTSMKLRKRSCIALLIMMILSCFFGGLQFMFFHSSLCNELILDERTAYSTCTLNKNGYAAIAAVILWFIAVLGSGAMVHTYY